MNDTSRERSRQFFLLGAVFVAALFVRALAIATATGNPSFATPITDAGTYDSVARHLWQTGEASPRLFWQPFLYPLQLAAVYATTDGSILAAKQALKERRWKNSKKMMPRVGNVGKRLFLKFKMSENRRRNFFN